MKKIDEKKPAYTAAYNYNPQAALTVGASLIIMAVAAGIAFGYLHGRLVIPGNAEATARTIAGNTASFVIEVILWWIIVATDVAVSIGLFQLYRDKSPALSALAMSTRLVYSLILAAGVIILSTAAGAGANALARIDLFEKIWSLGLIIFGVHLFLLGMASAKGRSTPSLLSWLLGFAGICYSAIHLLRNLGTQTAPMASKLESVLAAPMALAEMILAVWLIYGFFKSRGNG